MQKITRGNVSKEYETMQVVKLTDTQTKRQRDKQTDCPCHFLLIDLETDIKSNTVLQASKKKTKKENKQRVYKMDQLDPRFKTKTQVYWSSKCSLLKPSIPFLETYTCITNIGRGKHTYTQMKEQTKKKRNKEKRKSKGIKWKGRGVCGIGRTIPFSPFYIRHDAHKKTCFFLFVFPCFWEIFLQHQTKQFISKNYLLLVMICTTNVYHSSTLCYFTIKHLVWAEQP